MAATDNVNGFSKVVQVIWDVITTVLGVVIFVVELVVGTLASLLLFLLEIVWAIPILGRVLRMLLCLGWTVVWQLAGVLDMVMWALEIRPAKKLRIQVVLCHDGTGPVVPKTDVIDEIQRAIDVFYEQANVRVISSSPIAFNTAFHGKGTADDSYISEMTSKTADDVLTVSCNAGAFGEDLWVQGFWLHMYGAMRAVFGNFRRLIGYGAPVVVFVVKDFHGSHTGCSLGPLTDYITVRGPETADDTTIAHELGHACGLVHDSDATNLMYGTDSDARRDLSGLQAAWVRNSRHVTYF